MERGLATREQLLSVARRLFAHQGYDATSIEAVLREAGTSRGALYHHFGSKEALFEAVLEEVEADIATRVSAAADGEDDPGRALLVGSRAFLRMVGDAEVRQIVLLDAPAVVGWERWREIDARHAFGLVLGGVALACERSGLPAHLVEPLAHIVLAAVMEAALLVARSDRPRATLRQVDEALTELLARLFPEPARGRRRW